MLALWIHGERGHLLRPSTRNALRAAGWRRSLKLQPIHMYVYMRWMNEYIHVAINWFLPWAPTRLLRKLAHTYHGKVLTPEQAAAIVTHDHSIEGHDLEQVIPYNRARELVLHAPPEIAVVECVCRLARKDHCTPTQVCMVVGQPFVDFVLEHHRETSRRLSREEALQMLADEHERGHVHTAWFKGAMLDRFYVICNCCSCCCGGIEAMTKFNTPVLVSSGFVAQIDPDLCSGCGDCEERCAFDAIHVNGTAGVSWDACMGCGVCTALCPTEAGELVLDAGKGPPLDVRQLG